VLKSVTDCEANFATERDFYMQTIQKSDLHTERLNTIISSLEQSLKIEQTTNTNLFVDEHVDQLCQRALFSYQDYMIRNEDNFDRKQRQMQEQAINFKMRLQKAFENRVTSEYEKSLEDFIW